MRRIHHAAAVSAAGLFTSFFGLTPGRAQPSPIDTNHVVVIDRSGSMAGVSIDLAKTSARIYRDTLVSSNLPPSVVLVENLGIASYSSAASITFPISAPDDPGYDAAVDTLIASGSTSIGAGLEQALDMLLAENPSKGPRECVVLLSDGIQNTDPSPSAFRAAYQSRVDEVHTIALGDGADERLMSEIAANFGVSPGLYLRADNVTALEQVRTAGAFHRLANDCRMAGVVDQDLIEIPSGATECNSVLVSGAQIVDFTTIYAGSVAPEIVLHPPATHPTLEITESNFASSGSDITLYETQNFERFSLNRQQPYEEGFWEACVTNISPDPLFLYSAVSTLLDPAALAVTASALSVGVAPLAIRAGVSYAGQPLRGAQVSAEMRAPSGALTTLSFFDDGLGVHADIAANDGVYSTLVGNFAEAGSHEITVFADFGGSASVPMLTRQHGFGIYKQPTALCTSLGNMSNPRFPLVDGPACFFIEKSKLPTAWTPSTLRLQMSPIDGTPLAGVSVAINAGAPQAAPATSWSHEFSMPFPGRSSDVFYTVTTSSSRRLQVQWYP